MASGVAVSSEYVWTLQRFSKAPICVLSCERVGRERFRIHVWAVVRPEPDLDREADRVRVLTEVLRGQEAALRQAPSQWLWGLRRWQRRPEGEEMGRDGLPARVDGRGAGAGKG